MTNRLPPLNALRAFEAAARHLSFRKAAEELHVTPAAISHQIKALEDELGVRLFNRLARGLELTAPAQEALPRLRAGFDSLSESVGAMRRHLSSTTLSVGSAPSFAAKWLIPRLQRFVSRYPECDVRVAAGPEFIDRAGEPQPIGAPGKTPEIAIRFGSGHYPGKDAQRLFSVTATALCSPRLLQGEHALRAPQELRFHTLLHDDSMAAQDSGTDWRSWLEAAGVEGVDVERGPHFNHAALALDAAADGVGVVLSYGVLASSDVASGRLVAPFDISIPASFSYYMVSEPAQGERTVLSAFRNWLLEEASGSV